MAKQRKGSWSSTETATPQSFPPTGGWRLDGSWGNEVPNDAPLTRLMYHMRAEIRNGSLSPADCVRKLDEHGFTNVIRNRDQWLDIESFRGWNLAYASSHAEGSLKLMYRYVPHMETGNGPANAAAAHEIAERILATCRARHASRKAEYDCLLVAGAIYGRGGSVDECCRIVESKLEAEPA